MSAGLLKKLEALVQLALSRAAAGTRVLAALRNVTVFLDGNIGPVAQIVSQAPAFTTHAGGSGRVLVIAMIGGSTPVGDEVLVQVARDGAQVPGSPTGVTPSATFPAGAEFIFGRTVAWIDTVTAGSTHQWGIVATPTTGPTISSGNNAIGVLIIELP